MEIKTTYNTTIMDSCSAKETLMKSYKLLIFLFSCFILFTSEGHSEWQLSNEICIGDKYINSFYSVNMVYYNNKLFLSDPYNQRIAIVDAETFAGIGEIIPSGMFWITGMAVLNDMLVLSDQNGNIQSYDINTYTQKKSLSTEMKIYDIYTDGYNNKIYFSTFDMSKKMTLINRLDGNSLSEDYRIELNNSNSIIPKPCAIKFDTESNLLFVAVQSRISTPPENEMDYVKNHQDSLLVFDSNSRELIKTITVGSAPRDILIDYKSDKIYVYCVGGWDTSDTSGGQSNDFLMGKITVIDRITLNVIDEISFNFNFMIRNALISENNNLLYCGGNIISLDDYSITIIQYNENDLYNKIIIDNKNEEIFITNRNHIYAFDAISGNFNRQIDANTLISSPTLQENKNTLFFLETKQSNYYICSLDFSFNEINKVLIDLDAPQIIKNHPTKDIIYILTNNSINTFNITTKSIENKFLFNGSPLARLTIDEELNKLFLIMKGSTNYLYILDLSSLNLIDRQDLGDFAPIYQDIDIINHKLYLLGNNEIYTIDCKSYEKILVKQFINFDEIIVIPGAKKIYCYNTLSIKIIVYDLTNFEQIGSVNLSDYFNGSGGLGDFTYVADLQIIEKTNELILRKGYNIAVINIDTDTIKYLTPITYTSQQTMGRADIEYCINRITGELFILNPAKSSFIIINNPDYPKYIPPAPPQNIFISIKENIELSWDSSANSEAQGYNIYRSLSETNQWVRLNDKAILDTTFTDTTAMPNTPYDYRITTMGLYNIEGEPSKKITATLLLEPGFEIEPVPPTQTVEPNTNVDYVIASESVERFAENIDLSVKDLPPGITAAFVDKSSPDSSFNKINSISASGNSIKPGEIAVLSLQIPLGFAPGDYNFSVVGKSGDIEKTVPVKLVVVKNKLNESSINLTLNNETIEFGDAVFVTGRIIPPVSADVSITYTSENDTKVITARSDNIGIFSADFAPETEGVWTVKSSWSGNTSYSGAESQEKQFEVLSGKTKITCTTDAPAEAKAGWQITIKGKVFPNPKLGSVTLYVTKPDGTKETINGLQLNELGYYGTNITADRTGLWSVSASWAGNNKYLGAVSENLVIPYGLDIGRSIIAVCPPMDKAYYTTANNLGKVVFDTFIKRRFDNPRIKYFDANINQDLNGDGFNNDVDGTPTPENIGEAITTWAAEAVNDTTPMYLYLIGEDTNDGIELPGGKGMAASKLKELLDTMQTKSNCNNITSVIEAPNAETLLNQLLGQGRCVVTSTNKGEAASVAEGKLSFTQYFCNYANQGKSIRDAFLNTKNILSQLPGGFKSQEPQIDSDGNGISNEVGDFERAAQLYLGSSYGLQDMMPEMKYMSASSVIEKGLVGKTVINTKGVLSGSAVPQLTLSKVSAMNGVNIFVKADDFENNISNVYATIFSPSDEISQELELTDTDKDGRYDGVVTDLNDFGSYKVITYAYDKSKNVSEPMKTLIVVVDGETTEIEEQKQPKEFHVYNPYPNPFNPSTTIRYELPEKTNFELVIYDILGRKVRVLDQGYKSSGTYETIWDGKTDNGLLSASGVYIYKLRAGKYLKQGKMVLMK